MSTNIIFTVPGRTTNYMPIDVNAPKEVILEKYARESYSTENTWPYDSPSAGYYDITNSDTKLILLNKKITWSHLRGKTKPKREPFVKDEFYDWVEKEIGMRSQSEKNSNSSKDQLAAKRTVDPSRHFSAIGCTFKPEFKEESANTFKSKSLSKSAYSWSKSRINTGETGKTKDTDKNENSELINYFYDISSRKVGLQDKTHVKKPPYEFLHSYNINHPGLKNGQRLFLSNLCQVYSVASLKNSKKNQYLSLLDKQKEIDKYSNEKFKIHKQVENFVRYQEYIKSERPVPNFVNCGYLNAKQVKSFVLPKKSSKRSFYTANDLKQQSESVLSSSSDSYSPESIDLNSENEKDPKAKILSDLSNTDYESSSLSSQSTFSSKSSNSGKESETSRIDSKSVSKLSLKNESSLDKPIIEAEPNEAILGKPSQTLSSFETTNTNRSEFLNNSRAPSLQIKTIKTPSKACNNAPKISKPIQIVRKSEDEEE